jgi:hypothetical protein
MNPRKMVQGKEAHPHPGPPPRRGRQCCCVVRELRGGIGREAFACHGACPVEVHSRGGENFGENSPKNSRIEPMNHPGQDITKTLRAFLPLRVGGVCGADGERGPG